MSCCFLRKYDSRTTAPSDNFQLCSRLFWKMVKLLDFQKEIHNINANSKWKTLLLPILLFATNGFSFSKT
jgi:hypothetical protein